MTGCTIIRRHECSNYHGKLFGTFTGWAWEIRVLDTPNSEAAEVVQKGNENTYNKGRDALMAMVEEMDMEVSDPYAPDNVTEINEMGLPREEDEKETEWWEIYVKERDYR